MEAILEFISSHWLFILIILFQLFSKKKTSQDEEKLDELFTLPEDENHRPSPLDIDLGGSSTNSSQGLLRPFSRSPDQLIERIHSLNSFIEETLTSCQRELDQLRERVDVHSAVGRALPATSERESDLLDQTKRCIDQHFDLERRIQVLSGRGLDDPKNINELLMDTEALMKRAQSLSEDIHALQMFADSISAVHEDFVLAQSLRLHALNPLIEHRQAEGKALAPLPLALPPNLNHNASTLKQRGFDQLEWF
jgi:hypothetical protein